MDKTVRYAVLLAVLLLVVAFSACQNFAFADHNTGFSYQGDVDVPVHSADEVRDILGTDHVFGVEALPFVYQQKLAREPKPPFLRIDVLRCKRQTYCFMFLDIPETIWDIQVRGDVSVDRRAKRQDFASFVNDKQRFVQWRLVYFMPKPYRGHAFPRDQQFGHNTEVASAEVATRALLWDPAILAGRSVITRTEASGNNRAVISKSQDGGMIQISRRNFAFEEDWIAVEVLPR